MTKETENHKDKLDPLPLEELRFVGENHDILDHVLLVNGDNREVSYDELLIRFEDRNDEVEKLVEKEFILLPRNRDGEAILTFCGLLYCSDDLKREILETARATFDRLRIMFRGSDGKHKVNLKVLTDNVYAIPFPYSG